MHQWRNKMANVERDASCLQTSSSHFYAEMVRENVDLAAENDQYMQREENTFSTFSRRRDEQKSSACSEMWKSGRLRVDKTKLRSDDEQDKSRISTLWRIISQMGQSNSFVAFHWNVLLFAAILCVFLSESQLCSASCHGLGTTGRAILTDLEGVISDHPNESYPTDTECEWLITGETC